MFVGSYSHTLDGKGRLVLPAKFRHHFDMAGYLAPGERCIGLWLPEAFESSVNRLREQVRTGEATRHSLRGFLANSDEVRPDAQGRILISERLREYADLERDVVLAGQQDFIEIWDAERWRSLETDIDESVVQAFVDGKTI